MPPIGEWPLPPAAYAISPAAEEAEGEGPQDEVPEGGRLPPKVPREFFHDVVCAFGVPERRVHGHTPRLADPGPTGPLQHTAVEGEVLEAVVLFSQQC